MSQPIEALYATVETWRSRNPERQGGVVLVWKGEVYGWKNKLRDAVHERPGAYAVDEAGHLFIAEGIDVDLLIKEDVTSPLTLFTSEAETLYGSNAVFLCTEHPYVKKLCQGHDSDLSARIAALQDPKVTADGLSLDRHARHPLTGTSLPIYVVNYLAFDGREQAIFSVPDTDLKAASLCQRFGLSHLSVLDKTDAQAGLRNSASFSGLSRNEARVRIEANLIDDLARTVVVN